MRTLIVFIDKDNGLSFAGKRQSKDREAIRYIGNLLNGETLSIAPYSEKLFEGSSAILDISEDYLKSPASWFLSERGDADPEDFDRIITLCWNRAYPSDRKFILPEGMHPVKKDEFKGYSHERITVRTYIK